jgi:hypothetical protein
MGRVPHVQEHRDRADDGEDLDGGDRHRNDTLYGQRGNEEVHHQAVGPESRADEGAYRQAPDLLREQILGKASKSGGLARAGGRRLGAWLDQLMCVWGHVYTVTRWRISSRFN